MGIFTAMTLAVAGCGGVAAPGSSTDRGNCGGEVKIGAPYPLSGPFAEFGQNSLQGMQVAADEINKAGGVKALGGARLAVVPGDTAFDPNQAANVTTKLIQSDKVVALVGSYASNLTLTASTAAEKARVPMLSQSWVDQLAARGYQYYFQPPPQSSVFGTVAATGIIDASKAAGHPLRTAAAAGSTDAATASQMTHAADAARAAGLTVAEPTLFPVGLTDATPVASTLVAQHPDLIFLGGGVGDVSLVIKAVRARGVNVPIVGTGGAYVTQGIEKALGDNVEGLLSAAAWNDDLKLPGVDAATAAYRARYGTSLMPMESGESWVDVHLVATAIERVASCDPQKIRDALTNLDVTNSPAAAMPGDRIKFDSRGLNQYAEPIIVQWQAGKLRTVWPAKYAVTSMQLPS